MNTQGAKSARKPISAFDPKRIEYRWAEGRYERLRELAGELVRTKVDLIVTHGTPASLAAKRATTTIPIVLASIGDPVSTGVVAPSWLWSLLFARS